MVKNKNGVFGFFGKLCFAFLFFTMFMACTLSQKKPIENSASGIQGTWKLITGTLIENGDTTITDYTKDLSFIKIINETHFAFLNHDINHQKDSIGVYSSGGGKYELVDSSYTEHLEYCSAREWENHDFNFTVVLKGDTLIQKGLEVVEETGVSRYNIEVYKKLQ
ncbi:MAG: hypothetical protein IPN72_21885 [Saprospiraceae bacterium]|nr:hypothetical protein [Saprospiraceae bacterium]